MPSRTLALKKATPDPCIVTLTDPDDAALDRLKALIRALFIDMESDVLPGRTPSEICSRRLACGPDTV